MTNTQKFPVLVHQSTITGRVNVYPVRDSGDKEAAAKQIIKLMWDQGEITVAAPKPGESHADYLARVRNFENAKRVAAGLTPTVVISHRQDEETDESWAARCALARRGGFVNYGGDSIKRVITALDVLTHLPQAGKTVTEQNLAILPTMSLAALHHN